MYLWLRYIRDAVQSSRRFDALDHDDVPETARSSGRDLLGVGWSFRLHGYRVHTVIIGADELVDDTARLFIEGFWDADQVFLSLSTSATEPADVTFTEMLVPAGRCPLEGVGGDLDFPTITFELEEVDPS